MKPQPLTKEIVENEKIQLSSYLESKIELNEEAETDAIAQIVVNRFMMLNASAVAWLKKEIRQDWKCYSIQERQVIIKRIDEAFAGVEAREEK